MTQVAWSKIIALLLGLLALFAVALMLYKYYPEMSEFFKNIGEKDLEEIMNKYTYDGAVLERVESEPNEITPPDTLSGECSGPLVETGYACWGGCKLRQSLIPVLREAEKIAKQKGYPLVVGSAWRSEDKQAQLRRDKGSLACGPTKGSYAKCPHVLGCAVDVSLRGTKDKALLENIMYEAGWVRYCKESWHFEYGTKRWQIGTEKGVKCT